ncbi:MAG: glutathione S-transferase family protein [Alphaproteobacteria bacterium]|nr:glutathione S-transferase family protein [Alphaproteobacteria bacterium]
MKLYSGPLSLFSRKVEIALAEKGLAFERVMVPFSQAEGYFPKHPDVLSTNPKGQVPVFIDGDLTLFDSTVINEYLEDAYPDPPILPGSPKMRARCRLLELTADEILLPDVVRLMHRTEPPNPDPAVQGAKEEDALLAEADIANRYEALDHQLAGSDYFFGVFTAADIAIFMVMLFAKRLGAPGFGSHNALSAWYARIADRPSVVHILREVAETDRSLSP